MRTRLDLGVGDILPEASAILAQQGVPPGAGVTGLVWDTAARAVEELASLLSPAGVLREVSVAEFAAIHAGQGRNDPRTPLDSIFPMAARLVLFAVTCGEEVGRRIGDLFEANEYALAAAVDAGASLAADHAAQAAQDIFSATLDGEAGVLRYSPGYCGWHISGQKALLDGLEAESVPITLTDSFLMRPLKSVSGVIVAGPPDIHRFDNDFPFCTACTSPDCRERLGSLGGLTEKET